MKLETLLPFTVSHPRITETKINGLCLDSRCLEPGEVFCACQGEHAHGEQFIGEAIQRGAVAVLKEASKRDFQLLVNDVPCINVPNLSQQLGHIAARFYAQPSHAMQIIGVTGTNGKTSVSNFIAQMLSKSATCGLLGTLGYGQYGELQLGQHTTPNAIHMQKTLGMLRDKQVDFVAMEVSSHALQQGRVNGVLFDTAVLTNLSRDHLDYHITMNAYASAKQRLFKMDGLDNAVINIDDNFGRRVLADLSNSVQPITYSLKQRVADIFGESVQHSNEGLSMHVHTPWGNGDLHVPLFGMFNVDNMLATLATLLVHKLPLDEVLHNLAHIQPVLGRMERFGQKPMLVVDYAHTPDALQQVLVALRQHCEGKLWCVFGCGGERDQGKRKVMGEIAQQYADAVIITDDNPRNERSDAIINDILRGCPKPFAVMPERKAAIRHAFDNAAEHDIILIAGKGHEGYQQIGNDKLPYSDRDWVQTLLAERAA